MFVEVLIEVVNLKLIILFAVAVFQC